MVSLKFLLLGSLVLASLTAYLLFEPLPEDFVEDRATLQALVAFTKVVNVCGHIGAMLGIGPFHGNIKRIYEAVIGTAQGLRSPDPTMKISEMWFDGVRVKVYKPHNFKNGGPGLIFVHGGGYCAFNADIYDELSEQMANFTDALVISVDYRRPPKSRYPTAHNDALDASRYFIKNAAEFGVNPNRIAILGESAGGNLAASVSLRLRDERFKPLPKLQVLVYPQTQSIDFKTPSHQANNKIIQARTMAAFYICYVTGEFPGPALLNDVIEGRHISSHVRDKYAKYLDHGFIQSNFPIEGYKSPFYPSNFKTKYPELEKAAVDTYFSMLLVEDLNGLPATYMMTCQLDPMRDDGILYVNRLRRSGVKVTHVNYPEAYHGIFLHLFRKYREETMLFVKNNL